MLVVVPLPDRPDWKPDITGKWLNAFGTTGICYIRVEGRILSATLVLSCFPQDAWQANKKYGTRDKRCAPQVSHSLATQAMFFLAKIIHQRRPWGSTSVHKKWYSSSSASYPDVSLSRWKCARKGRREGDSTLTMVPCGSSPVAPLLCEERSAWGGSCFALVTVKCRG